VKKQVPDGFVGDNDLGPFVGGEAGGHSVQLSCDDVDGIVGFSLL
jgi:hypothetical protein